MPQKESWLKRSVKDAPNLFKTLLPTILFAMSLGWLTDGIKGDELFKPWIVIAGICIPVWATIVFAGICTLITGVWTYNIRYSFLPIRHLEVLNKPTARKIFIACISPNIPQMAFDAVSKTLHTHKGPENKFNAAPASMHLSGNVKTTSAKLTGKISITTETMKSDISVTDAIISGDIAINDGQVSGKLDVDSSLLKGNMTVPKATQQVDEEKQPHSSTQDSQHTPECLSFTGNIEEDKQHLFLTRNLWRWQQLLRGVAPHIEAIKNDGEIYLIGSPGKFGSHKDLELCKEILETAYGLKVTCSERAVDFGDLSKLYKKLENVITHYLKRGRKPHDIIIDCTGGLKTTSITAAMVTLHEPEVLFQYVQTDGDFDVLAFNVVNARSNVDA